MNRLIAGLAHGARRWSVGAAFVSLVTLSAGCTGGPSKVSAPDVSPAGAAAKAMELYDADKDGKLSRSELEKVPGILRSIDMYDLDRDKHVSQQEITDRLARFTEHGVGLMQLNVRVIMSGRPLAGAHVKLVPEPFMAEMIKPAVGDTGDTGLATMNLDPADPAPGLPLGMGMQFGIYKIEITHPTATIPAKYNTETTLGTEASPVDMANPTVELQLSAR